MRIFRPIEVFVWFLGAILCVSVFTYFVYGWEVSYVNVYGTDIIAHIFSSVRMLVYIFAGSVLARMAYNR